MLVTEHAQYCWYRFTVVFLHHLGWFRVPRLGNKKLYYLLQLIVVHNMWIVLRERGKKRRIFSLCVGWGVPTACTVLSEWASEGALPCGAGHVLVEVQLSTHVSISDSLVSLLCLYPCLIQCLLNWALTDHLEMLAAHTSLLHAKRKCWVWCFSFEKHLWTFALQW